MVYSFKSSFNNLLLNLKIELLFTPWILEINFSKETISISQRKWYLIAKKINVISFRFIKEIKINEHIFGSDIHIRTMGTTLFAKYFNKNDVEKVKTLLIDYNNSKNNKSIVFS